MMSPGDGSHVTRIDLEEISVTSKFEAGSTTVEKYEKIKLNITVKKMCQYTFNINQIQSTVLYSMIGLFSLLLLTLLPTNE